MSDDSKLTEKISSLPTLQDIDALLKIHLGTLREEIREKFAHELKIRDKRIVALESKVPLIEFEARLSDVDCVIKDEVWDCSCDDEEKSDLDYLSVGDSIVKHLDPVAVIPGKSENVSLRGKSMAEAREVIKDRLKRNNIKVVSIHTGTNSIPHKPS